MVVLGAVEKAFLPAGKIGENRSTVLVATNLVIHGDSCNLSFRIEGQHLLLPRAVRVVVKVRGAHDVHLVKHPRAAIPCVEQIGMKCALERVLEAKNVEKSPDEHDTKTLSD